MKLIIPHQKILQKLLTEKCSFFYSRDTALEISMAEFGHIFLQFHGHVYLVQGIYQVILVHRKEYLEN